ncbi:MAG: type II secretion system F family protein [Verrucomicrobiota bacterium]
MSWFEYTALTESGETVDGRIQAESAEDLRWALLGRGLRPERVLEVSPPTDRKGFSIGDWMSPRAVHAELTLRQIAVMLRSGLTLLAAVETVIEQPPSRAIRRVYKSIRERIEGGSSFSEAMAHHSCFPSGVIAMVAMGEESGNLDLVIERGAQSMESTRRQRTATLTALFYPSFTFLFAIGICTYMIVAVIPPMKRALEALGRKLPALTQSLLDIADFFAKWGVAIGTTVVLLLIFIGLMCLWPPGRLVIDKILLRLPLIGTVLRTGSTALFARSMGTLISSGIPLVEGLRIMGNLHGNRYLSAVVESARRSILEGGTLAGSLSSPHAYTPMMLKMVSVGEASGNLEESLDHVADFHEDQLQALIQRLSALLEPAIVLLVGSLVGYVYIAFFVGLYGTM